MHGDADQEYRILVCGGDGTVTWILTALEKAAEKTSVHLLDVPVAIVPLGTGNDLARSLGWGGKLRAIPELLEYLRYVVEAEIVEMDQWRLVLRPHNPVPEEHKLRSSGSHPRPITDKEVADKYLVRMNQALQTFEDRGTEMFAGLWQNYYSFGFDAKVANSVDVVRSNTSCGQFMFKSGCGKVCYAWQAVRHSFFNAVLTQAIRPIKGTPPGNDGSFSEFKPSLENREVGCLRKGRLRQLMLVNINSYAAGQEVMPRKKDPLPGPSDGALEVLAVRNVLSNLAMAMRLLLPTYLESVGALAFTVASGQYMQLDGEPWRVDGGCDVLVEHHRKVYMLRAPASSHNWRGHVQTTFWGTEQERKSRISQSSQLSSDA